MSCSLQQQQQQQQQQQRPASIAYRALAECRIRDLFSMTIDYPDSQPGLRDLASCVEQEPQLRSQMVLALRADVQQRLLHPGVATLDILSAYIGAVRSLRLLDPSGVSQELALAPVADYLRQREDTIRAIISKMVSDDAGSCELAAELNRISRVATVGEDTVDSVDDPNQDFEAWCPDPVEAYSSAGSLSRQPSDLLSLLVGIYGSKSLFITEYQSMLANRLLDSLSFHIDREIKNLELLKLRFGEMDMVKSEVMLKDVEDSRRLCALIAQEEKAGNDDLGAGFPVQAFILSAQFWPPLSSSCMSMPGRLQAASQQFTQKYKSLKGNRSLDWKPQLGRVQLLVQVSPQAQPLRIVCKPVHYALLMCFMQHKQRRLPELAEAAELQLSYARRSIAFWLHHGVLQEVQPDTFRLAADAAAAAPAAATAAAAAAAGGEFNEAASLLDQPAAAGVEGDEEAGVGEGDEARETLWNYVMGMLTNMDSCLSLERMHSVLKLFLVGPGIGLEMRDLKVFLDDKVREGKLTVKAGLYKLP